MVRLIVVVFPFFRGTKMKFQFQYGSINGGTSPVEIQYSIKFQFQYGSINGFLYLINLMFFY